MYVCVCVCVVRVSVYVSVYNEYSVLLIFTCS